MNVALGDGLGGGDLALAGGGFSDGRARPSGGLRGGGMVIAFARPMRSQRPISKRLFGLLALVWMGGCSIPAPVDNKPSPREPYIAWYPAYDPILVGEPVPLVNIRTEGAGACEREWRVEPEGAGAVTVGPAPKTGLQLTAQRAGIYFVTLRCGGLRATHRIEAFVPSAQIELSARPLPGRCADSAITGDGKRLLCVGGGVTVYDLDTLKELGHTAEHVPDMWGIATQGELFATASAGCGSHCTQGGETTAGARLYRVQPDGAPQLLAVLTTERSNEVAFFGSTVVVTTDGAVQKFDVRGPAHPRRVGCARGTYGGSLPVALPPAGMGGGEPDLLDVSPTQVRRIAGGVLGMDCSGEAPVAGTLRLSDAPSFLPIVDVSYIADAGGGDAHAFLLAARAGTPNQPRVVGGYHIVDLRTRATPRLLFQSDNEAYGSVAFDDRLLIANSARVALYDTSGLAHGDPPRALAATSLGVVGVPMRMYQTAEGTRMVADRRVWTLGVRPLPAK